MEASTLFRLFFSSWGMSSISFRERIDSSCLGRKFPLNPSERMTGNIAAERLQIGAEELHAAVYGVDGPPSAQALILRQDAP